MEPMIHVLYQHQKKEEVITIFFKSGQTARGIIKNISDVSLVAFEEKDADLEVSTHLRQFDCRDVESTQIKL